MLTNNAKKLLTADLTAPAAGSEYRGVYAALSGSFLFHNDKRSNQILNTNAATIGLAKQACVASITLYLFGYYGMGELVYIKKSNLPSDAWPASNRAYLVCTYDSDDSLITPDMVNVPGDDLSIVEQTVSLSLQNKHVVTITFNNASNDVMHVNRLGIYMPVQKYPYADNGGGCLLVHLLAIDDIALEPGQTKSITIQPDLD